MASELDICNLAYSHFGQDANIASLDENSREADAAKRFYPIARDELLEEYDWTFARVRATLAQVTNDRADRGYKFTRPSDCLKERRLLPDGYADQQSDAADYEREGNNIYADVAPATLVYTQLLSDTTRFSPTFVIALSYRLASYLAGPIVKDPSGSLQRALRTAGDNEAMRAQVSDANSERSRAAHTSTARGAR